MFDLKRTGRKRDIGVTVSRGRVAVQAPNHFSYNQVIKHLQFKQIGFLLRLQSKLLREGVCEVVSPFVSGSPIQAQALLQQRV